MSAILEILTWPFLAPIRWVSRIFSNEEKMRSSAENWIELADKVWNFRRDQLRDNEAEELLKRRDELRRQLKARADAGKLKLLIEALENVLRRTGGAIYPKSALVENVEFFLVAAIVILGIRTYFVQPFKIPTNSMWPTYYGMTPEVFRQPSDEPGPLERVFRLAAFGAFSRRVDAPASGEVLIPLAGSPQQAGVPYRTVSGRTWLVLPTTLKEYMLLVDEKPVTIRVPADFDFEWAVCEYFFPGSMASREPSRTTLGRIAGSHTLVRVQGEEAPYLRTGKQVRVGERVMSFDILTGDQLFVDRVSYHFVRPQVGSGFVFRTDHIDSMYMRDANGAQLEQYYIKRLVGVPGDTLEVQGTTLFSNGKPITGSDAFAKNAQKSGQYPGYRAQGQLEPGKRVRVENGSYFAMGDNSPNSQDSRYWGFVPAKDAVGRPLFVYYPFTHRWGPAR
jgi:signal peptidase I